MSADQQSRRYRRRRDGRGIAAQIANAGIPVVLLDIVPKGADNRNAIAEGAVAEAAEDRPRRLHEQARAKLVTTGNIEDHLDLLAECDRIVEAVLENPTIKQALYRSIDARPQARLDRLLQHLDHPAAKLIEGLLGRIRGKISCITHFFNPPRYMRLWSW